MISLPFLSSCSMVLLLGASMVDAAVKSDEQSDTGEKKEVWTVTSPCLDGGEVTTTVAVAQPSPDESRPGDKPTDGSQCSKFVKVALDAEQWCMLCAAPTDIQRQFTAGMQSKRYNEADAAMKRAADLCGEPGAAKRALSAAQTLAPVTTYALRKFDKPEVAAGSLIVRHRVPADVSQLLANELSTNLGLAHFFLLFVLYGLRAAAEVAKPAASTESEAVEATAFWQEISALPVSRPMTAQAVPSPPPVDEGGHRRLRVERLKLSTAVSVSVLRTPPQLTCLAGKRCAQALAAVLHDLRVNLWNNTGSFTLLHITEGLGLDCERVLSRSMDAPAGSGAWAAKMAAFLQHRLKGFTLDDTGRTLFPPPDGSGYLFLLCWDEVLHNRALSSLLGWYANVGWDKAVPFDKREVLYVRFDPVHERVVDASATASGRKAGAGAGADVEAKRKAKLMTDALEALGAHPTCVTLRPLLFLCVGLPVFTRFWVQSQRLVPIRSSRPTCTT